MARFRFPDSDDTEYLDDDRTDGPRLCDCCRNEPADADEEMDDGRLAICSRCATGRMARLVARAAFAAVGGDEATDADAQRVFERLAQSLWVGAGRDGKQALDMMRKLLDRRKQQAGG